MEFPTVATIVIILIALIVVVSLCANGHCKNGYSVKQDFCKEGLSYGSGSIDYCKGKPFVCAADLSNCYFLESNVVGENCKFVGIVGKGGHQVCEEILWN
jgi:hypothetical protein